jgi:hypothetical protein
MAEADADRIVALLKTVQTESAAVQELLRRTAGDRLWEIVHPHEVSEAEVSLERADELRAKWRTELGQVWQIGLHRLVCGNCTNTAVIARLWCDGGFRFRLLWTDPPYGVSYAAKTAWMERHGAQRARRPIENDDLTPEEVAALFTRALTIATEHAESGATMYATVPSGPMLPVFIAAMESGGFSYGTLWFGSSRTSYSGEAIITIATNPFCTAG